MDLMEPGAILQKLDELIDVETDKIVKAEGELKQFDDRASMDEKLVEIVLIMTVAMARKASFQQIADLITGSKS